MHRFTPFTVLIGLFTFSACELVTDFSHESGESGGNAGSIGKSSESFGGKSGLSSFSEKGGTLAISGAFGKGGYWGGGGASSGDSSATGGSKTTTDGMGTFGGTRSTSDGTGTSLIAGNSAVGGMSGSIDGTYNSTMGGKNSTGGTVSIGSGTTAMGGSAGAGTGGITSSGGVAAGGVTSSGGVPFGGCPVSKGGPTLVELPDGYCIDATEVTQFQYESWLKTTNSSTIAAQDQALCGWNTSFDPAVSYTSCVTTASCATNCDNKPQRCIDWCDAIAFCKGVGKRLCGKIGGGSNAFADYADTKKSQWYNACSSHGAFNYPYGNTYQSTNCNGPENALQNAQAVRSFGQCQAPASSSYAGVFDLSGNVKEFQDSCESTAVDSRCLATGGAGWTWYMASSDDYPSYMGCGYLNYSYRNVGSPEIGFRCCSP